MVQEFSSLIVNPLVSSVWKGLSPLSEFMEKIDKREGERGQYEIIDLITKFAIQCPSAPFLWDIPSHPALA